MRLATIDELTQLLTSGIQSFLDGEPQRAETIFTKACVEFPDSSDAYNNLGIVLSSRGETELAAENFRKSLELYPNCGAVHESLGECLIRQGFMELAIHHLTRATELDPKSARAWFDLVQPLAELGRFNEAEQAIARAVSVDPTPIAQREPQARTVLARGLFRFSHVEPALQQMAKAMRAWYQGTDAQIFARASNELGLTAQHDGLLDEAIGLFQLAQTFDPEFNQAYTNLFWCIQHSDHHTLEDSHRLAVEWAALHAPIELQRRQVPLPTSGKIRVGFLSPGFTKDHPTAHTMWSLLKGRSQERFEYCLYSNARVEDTTSASFKIEADLWRNIAKMSDDRAADQIQSDGIHILVDLTGHCENNRIGIFARKPAPIQAEWLGYYATTGLKQIDYFICNPALIPPEEAPFYVEKPIHVEGKAFCHESPAFDVPVSELPAARNGHVTFGCHNYLAKVGDRVLDVWCKVLQEVPESRFVMNRHAFLQPVTRERFYGQFEKRGISRERVRLFSTTSKREYLESLGLIDVFLDTFPFNGGTSIYDAVWMGLPVITMVSPKMVGHFGESILSGLGFPEWVAHNEAEYVEKAAGLGRDLDQLASIRSSLRQKFLSSPLSDANAFTREIEAVFLEMVQRTEDAHASSV